MKKMLGAPISSERLAQDLQKEFPAIRGFSRTNIFRMQAFFVAYEKVAQAVRLFENLPVFNIPWGHNILFYVNLKLMQRDSGMLKWQ